MSEQTSEEEVPYILEINEKSGKVVQAGTSRGRDRWALPAVTICAAALMALTVLATSSNKAVVEPGVIATAQFAIATPAITTEATPTVLDYVRPGMLSEVNRRGAFVSASLSQRKALNGFVASEWLEIAQCPEGSTNWQIDSPEKKPGVGFLASKGGFGRQDGFRTWGRWVLDKLFVVASQPLGVYTGSGTLSCYRGSSDQTVPNYIRPVEYSIFLGR